jgi:hypothetical protein
LRIKELGTHLTLNEHDDDDDDKTLHVSGISFAHNQEFSTVHSALVSFMLVMMTVSKQSQDGTPSKFHAGF